MPMSARRSQGVLFCVAAAWCLACPHAGRAIPPEVDDVHIDLGEDTADRMTHPQVTLDGNTTTTIGGVLCRKNVTASKNLYSHFAVSDIVTFQGNQPELHITIRYYDTSAGSLSLQYDSSTGTGIAAEYRTSGHLTNTNDWLTFTYHVTDAYFGNRENGGADFRIARSSSGTFYLDTVTVSIPHSDKCSVCYGCHEG